jgi:hypothetical protein
LYFPERYVYFQCCRRDKVLSKCGVNGPVRSKQEFWDKPFKVPVATSLNAFLGTFTVLNESFHSDILCSLPASALDLAQDG